MKKTESGPIFREGLMVSNVSRIIAIYKNDSEYELTKHNKFLLKKASKYVEDILRAQYLISGTKNKGAPSTYGMIALNDAMGFLPELNVQAVHNSEKRKEYFYTIKIVLDDMVDKPKNSIKEENLIQAKNFFVALTKNFLKNVENRIRFDHMSLEF